MKGLWALVMMVCVGCADPDASRIALEGAGYSQIQMTGYELFGCSKDDLFHDGFTARGMNGKQVEGVVCSGLLKGATIRISAVH